MITIDRTGCARIVFLTKQYAWKIPNFLASDRTLSWRLFCQGMLANMQEVVFSRTGWVELCPVLWHLPLGLLVVMPKVQVLTQEEFDAMDFQAFVEQEDYCIPIEEKANSLGWLDGKIVAIDYGN